MDMTGYNSENVEGSGAAEYLRTLDSLFLPMSPLPTNAKPRTSPGAEIDAVLFDIYGTLMISEAGDIGLTALDGDSGDETLTILGESGEKTLSFSALKAKLVELIRAEHARIKAEDPRIIYPEVDIISLWSRIFFDEFGEGFSLSRVAETALLFETMSNRVDLMPGTIDILSFLRNESLPLGIVSNAQFYTPLLLEHLCGRGLEEMGFDADCLSWSYRCGCGKPDRRIFQPPLRTLEARGIAVEKILYVGNDMLNDIATAASLGLKTALFAGDKRSLRLREDDERVNGISPDFVVTRLDQLKKIVQAG